MNDALPALLAARNDALSKLDLEYAYAIIGRRDPELALLTLHKARYECVGVEPALRHESGAWLRARGFRRYRGDLLPVGELPE